MGLSASSRPHLAEIIIFHPYFFSGGSEKTTVSWMLSLKSAGVAVALLSIDVRDENGHLKTLNENGVEIINIKQRSIILAVPKILRAIYSRASRPRAIVGVEPHAFYWFPILRLIFSDMTLVASFRNHPDSLAAARNWKARLVNALLPLALRFFDVISSNSKESLVDLKAHQVTRRFQGAYRYVRNVVNVESRGHRADFFGEETLRVCFIGRMCEQKNPLLALAILDELSTLLPVSAKFVGGGALESMVKKKSTGLRVDVEFFGTSGNVIEILETSDLLLCTSRYEGFPNIFLEAAITKTPIATVDFKSGVKELVKEHGGLVIPSEPTAAARAIAKFIRDKHTVDAVTTAMFDATKEHYSYDGQQKDLMAIF